MQLIQRRSTFNVHELFGDLIFNALVVTLLFVAVLSIMVNRHITTETGASDRLAEATDRLAEVERDSQLLADQKSALEDRTRELEGQAKDLTEQLEQRGETASSGFIGSANRPQFFYCQYIDDDGSRTFTPVPSRLVQAYGTESTDEQKQVTKEQLEVLRKVRSGYGTARHYSVDEFGRIVTAFSSYFQCEWDRRGAVKKKSPRLISATHVPSFSLFVRGLVNEETGRVWDLDRDRELARRTESLDDIKTALSGMGTCPQAESMTPVVACELGDRRIVVNGVTFSPDDFRALLDAINGNVRLEFGCPDNEIPDWLYNEVLLPMGYFHRARAPLAE